MKWLYWSIPILLFILQLIFILNSNAQIRYEDLAESVRNVFWLNNHQVYDGVSSNIGWYGTVLIIYKVFGFHLHAAKFFKLALYLVSMICLALMLKKWVKYPVLPLLTIGLSPTLLFYCTTQASHGIDLLYFPIVLFLLIQKKWWSQALGGLVACWAWMSYPTFIFYLPVLFILKLTDLKKIKRGLLLLLAFLLPIIIGFIYVQNRSTLFYDPQINSGIFRGAGGIDLSLDDFSHNLGGFFTDLFSGGKSYHFEIFMGDFSLIFPILTVIFILILSFKLKGVWGKWIIGGLVLVLILSSFTLDPSGFPGMRRYTPILAAFYTLFVLEWKQLVNFKLFQKKLPLAEQISNSKFLGIGLMFLLLLHHLIVYPINLIHLQDPSPNKEPIWFSRLETPQKSLENLVDTVQKEDLKLVCLDQSGKPFFCRIVEVYAAVEGACIWNHLNCHQILGLDPKTGQLIPLNIKLWDEYYFEH